MALYSLPEKNNKTNKMQTDNSTQRFRKKVLITGVVQLWEGHSNVEHKIKLFFDETLYDSKHRIINVRFKINYKTTITKFTSTCSLIAKLILGSLFCLAQILTKRSYQNIYLPYPSLALIFFISLLPKPAVSAYLVLDFFISIYDTVVIDRALLSEKGLLARLLYRIERRSIQRADTCLVDTDENARYYADLFCVSIEKFKAVPLSINEEYFQPTEPRTQNNSASVPLRVLFAGTMVPLQGIPYICDTIRTLAGNKSFKFIIIGDGQDSNYVEKLSNDLKQSNSPVEFTWKKEWMSSLDLSNEIKKADVCLGIFGTSEKANRVWPFKNYLYMACKKALITRSSLSSERLLTSNTDPAFITVDSDSKQELSNRLLDLLENQHLIEEYAINARHFYTQNLSTTAISIHFYDAFR